MSQLVTPSQPRIFFWPPSLVAAAILLLMTALDFHRNTTRETVPLLTISAEYPPSGTSLEPVVIHVPLPDGGPAVLIIGSLGDAACAYPLSLEFVETDPGSQQAVSHVEVVSTGHERSPRKTEFQAPRMQLPRPPSTPQQQPRQRVFFLQTAADPAQQASYSAIPTTLITESDGVKIWWEDGLEPAADPNFAASLAQVLEREVLPKIDRMLGEITDLDEDGTLAVCITSRLAAFPRRDTPVYGLVQINDFQTHLPRPFSNHADVMFLSPDIPRETECRAILAHEAAHLATFSRRRDIDADRTQFDGDWLNEGLAHTAEIACTNDWSNLKRRWRSFLAHSADSPLDVDDAHRQGLWANAGTRGAAWSFVAWLADEFGSDMLRQMAEHPLTGREKLAWIAQEPFAELFRRWSVSVAVNQLPMLKDSVPLQKPKAESPAIPAEVLTPLELQPEDVACQKSLRGTAWLACRLPSPQGERRGLRITAPADCQVQVTQIRMCNGQQEIQRIR